ncbi:MAG: hypothetical protein ACRD0U_20990, partial [Acidimicrobiales bacterium]
LEAALAVADLAAGRDVAVAIRGEMVDDPAAFDFTTVDGVIAPSRSRRWRLGRPWRRRPPRREITLVHS